MNEVLQRINDLMKERKWTLYVLAKKSGVPYSSLSSLFKKNNQPTISTLEKICAGFQITMADFFSSYTPPFENEADSYSPEETGLIQKYRKLDKKSKKLLSQFIDLLLSQK